MMDVSQNIEKKNELFTLCSSCRKRLQVSQIHREKIDEHREFTVFTFYCHKCDLYVLDFKTIKK